MAFNANTLFDSHIHSFNIKAKEYLDNKFGIVFDTEKNDAWQALRELMLKIVTKLH